MYVYMYICIYVYMYICIYVDLLLVALIIKVGFCNPQVLRKVPQSISKACKKQARSATKRMQEALPKGSSKLLNHKSRLQAMETQENQGYRSAQAY